MVLLYVLTTKIYHFLAIFLQFRQIINLHPIDSGTDRWAPFISAEVAKTREYLLTRTEPYILAQIKN
jgi:hypothetical protein